MRLRRCPELPIADGDEPLTGIVPMDMHTIAPDYLDDAVAAFAPAPYTGEAIRVNPRGNLTEEELHANDDMKRAILESTRRAALELGVQAAR